MNGEEMDAGEDVREPREDAPRAASEKQIGFIRSLQRTIGFAGDELAKVLGDVAGKSSLEELSIREASEVIDELQTQARERGIDLDAQARATPKQLQFIRSLKRRAHLTDDELARLLEERAGVNDIEQLGRREASAFIDELLAQAGGEAGGGGAGKRGGQRGPAERSRPARPSAPPEDGGGWDDGDPPF